ncbi:YcjF family protein [Rhodospirillum sp. A1_3_36]|uniref:YcjF family protein n=1 Tax=Rhodospirillum sp. A1_3_36 TaxID=3391666 RepID=UPI0039A50DC2
MTKKAETTAETPAEDTASEDTNTKETTIEEGAPALTGDERLHQAQRLVRRASVWGFGAGCIPLPLVDLATVTGLQLKMISNLSNLYGIPFRDHTAKNIVAGLLGSILPKTLATGSVGSLLKSVPLFGSALGLLSMPSFSSAATYAIGQVFIKHMESGGTLLDFDVDKMRGYFIAEFEAQKAETTSEPTKVAS